MKVLHNQILYCFHLDESYLIRIFKNQISMFVIDITRYDRQNSPRDMNIILTQISAMFSNLKYLNFCPSSIFDQQLSFDRSPPTVISSTLLELHVSLQNFVECLHLLDGHFNQLHILHVHIVFIHTADTTINDEVDYSD